MASLSQSSGTLDSQNDENIIIQVQTGNKTNEESTNNCSKPKVKGRFWKTLFTFVSVTVQVALLLKVPLYILRQAPLVESINRSCLNRSDSNRDINQQYLFTIVMYSFTFTGRWIEALIIHIHIYKFIFQQTTIKPSKFLDLCLKKFQMAPKNLVLFVCLALYMLLHSLAVPALGMALEHKQVPDELDCYIYEHHFAYWILDTVRYLHDVAIRLLMVLATFATGMLWSINKPDDVDDVTEEPNNYDDYLMDKEATNKDHQDRTRDYAQRGGEVECILEIFQTWFVMPWVLYFFSSSLDTENIIRTWRNNSEGRLQQQTVITDNDGKYDFTEVSFMVYNLNQILLLAVAYMCSKKMNTQHYKYQIWFKQQQIETFQTSSRQALASMNEIEKEDNFDFVPCIWGSSIKIQVDNPLYVIILFISTFFTIMEGLI